MTPEEREKMDELCKKIAVEKDPDTFGKLLDELNALFELKHQRIHPGQSQDLG